MKYFTFIIALLFVFTFSCKKKKSEEVKPEEITSETVPSYTNLVSIRKLFTITSGILGTTIPVYSPALSPLVGALKYDVDLYKIRYKTNFQGKPSVASGLICVPRTDTIKFPTLSFQHGTLFSIGEVPGNYYFQQIQIAALASVGYFTLAPDYLGFDSTYFHTHPYYVAEYSSSSVCDMVLAAKEFANSKNLKLNKQLFLAGYSQGGNVTMATAKKIESNPVSDFELTASAAGSGGYNLNGIFKTITAKDTFPSPNYLAFIIQSFRKTYEWDTPLDYYFKPTYSSKIDGLINGKTTGTIVNQNLTVRLDSLLQKSFVSAVENGTDITFSKALTENSIHDWKPTLPLRLYHGDADEIVPYTDSDSTYKHMLSLGSTSVTFIPLPNQNHSSGALPMVSDVLLWFNSLVK